MLFVGILLILHFKLQKLKNHEAQKCFEKCHVSGFYGRCRSHTGAGTSEYYIVLVDDMGWQDTSVPFYSDSTALNARYHTPNMERLAAMGVRFTEAYACAISSPTRCSLMSGMNAARHRVTNWTLNYDQKTDAGSDVLQLPEWNYNGIQPDSTDNPDDLKTPL